MEFLTFEDETELVETTFFPKAYGRFCTILDKSRPFMLYGKVEKDFGAVTMTVERVEGMKIVQIKIALFLSGMEYMDQAKAIL